MNHPAPVPALLSHLSAVLLALAQHLTFPISKQHVCLLYTFQNLEFLPHRPLVRQIVLVLNNPCLPILIQLIPKNIAARTCRATSPTRR